MTPTEVALSVTSLLIPIAAVIFDRRHRAGQDTKERVIAAEKSGEDKGATTTELRHLIDLIGEVRSDVKQVPALVRDVDWLKESISEQTRRLTSHIHSDHREIREDIKDIRDSIHDGD